MSSPAGNDASPPPAVRHLRHWIGPLFAAVVCIAALLVIRQELKHHGWREILQALANVRRSRIALAIGLTAVNYVWLSGYDALAVRYLKHPLRRPLIMLGAFVGYSLSHNFGWMLGGTASRIRLYSGWGFTAVEIVKLFAMLGLTFWAGYCGLAGLVFLIDPLPMPERLHLPLASTFWLGPILLTMLAVYLIACSAGRPLSLWGRQFELPPLRLALLQVVVASGDLLLTSGVMYVLLPAELDIGYWRFANVVLLALAAAILSHVPGGVGVIELIVMELVPDVDRADLLGTLLAFRAIFYLLPLTCAVGLLGGHEWFARHRHGPGMGERKVE